MTAGHEFSGFEIHAEGCSKDVVLQVMDGKRISCKDQVDVALANHGGNSIRCSAVNNGRAAD